jgi:hypothetical protein
MREARSDGREVSGSIDGIGLIDLKDEDPIVKTTTLTGEQIGDFSPVNGLWSQLRRLFSSIRIQKRERKLRLCDSLALGEKRMIAVVEFEQQRFLVAATPNNISLLQALPASGGNENRAPEGT